MNNDIISRRAAIRWVKTECNPYGNPTLDFESGKKVMEHLERMPPAQPGWIPTSQKPPEPFKLVLIQDSCGGYDLTMYIPPRINPKQYPNGYWGRSGYCLFRLL